MLIEFLAQDIQTWESKDNSRTMCSWDYKDILSRAIIKIMELEKQQIEEEYKNVSPEELQRELEKELKGLSEILGYGEGEEPEGEE